MYRDDLAATHARLEQIQRELASAQSQGVQDQQRIAMLTQQLAATQQMLQRMGGQMAQMQNAAYMLPERGVTVLVLGILSLCVCGIMGPIAWVMGNEEMRRINSGMTSPAQRGYVQAGRICGIISSSLIFLCVGFFVFSFIVAAVCSN